MQENTLIKGMTFAEYRAIDRVSFSGLKYIEKSPLHFLHNEQNPSDPTPAMVQGSLFHTVCLRQEMARSFHILDEAKRPVPEKDYKTKLNQIWKKEQAAHAKKFGLEIASSNDVKKFTLIDSILREDADAGALLNDPNGVAEGVILWERNGIKLKSRLDWITDGITDLKKTKDAAPLEFMRQSYYEGYHVQAAAYSLAFRAAFGKNPAFYKLLAIEDTAPYHFGVNKLTTDALNSGAATLDRWLARLAACRASGKYPSYMVGAVGGFIEMGLPAWAN